MSRETLKRLYKPVHRYCEIRKALAEQDKKSPRSVPMHFKLTGKASAYQDVMDFIDKLIKEGETSG